MQNNKNKYQLQANYTNSESPNSISRYLSQCGILFVLRNKHASKLAKS